jgi:hypothetical protein
MATRIFRQKTYRSKRNAEAIYTTSILWGGTMQNPNIACTCPVGTFQHKVCGHGQRMWDELDSFAKQNVIHHDEIVAKPWYRGK